MNRLTGLLAFLFVVGVTLGATVMAEETPSAQLNTVVQEYQRLQDAFEEALAKITDDDERDRFVEKNHPRPEQYYPKLLALAEKHSTDPAAVEALIWIVNHSSPEQKDEAAQKMALEMLRRNHIASTRLPEIFLHADEPFLREVLEKSPHRQIRGSACFDLAEKLLGRIRTVSRWREEYPDWRKRQWLRQTQFAFLLTTDVEEVTKQSEALLDRVVQEYADVPIEGRRNGKTLGQLASGHLHEIRHLAVGMPAPNLESVDLEGRPARLADLKGRVVVLDVWATWCGPCRAMIPHERALVKRLAGRPFTLVSISADDDRETLTQFLKNEPMPWTHWFNGPQGSIIAALNVWSYPRIYVLDVHGVIRYKDVRGKLLDQAVDTLLQGAVGKSSPQ